MRQVRVCTECGEQKEKLEFDKLKDGYSPVCKECSVKQDEPQEEEEEKSFGQSD